MTSRRLLSIVRLAPLPLAVACSSGSNGPGSSTSGSAGTGSGATSGATTGTGGGSGSASTGSSGATGGGGTGAGTGSTGSSGGTGASGGAGASGGSGASGSAGSGAGTSGAAARDGGSATDGGDAGAATGDGGGAILPTNVAGTEKYQFTFGDVVFEVDQSFGARVDTLSVSGTNLVEPPVTDPTQWGSTFWTSPRSEWQPMTWPPPASIDQNPYDGGPMGSHLVVSSSVDPTMGISVDKDYSVDGASGWIHIAYTIHVTTAFKCAPWEDTRVPRGGIAFFPAGTVLDAGPTMLTTTGGAVWFDDTAMTATSPDGSKAIGDAMGGWSAYAVKGILFLKKFTDVPVSGLAPGEGDVDIYPGPGFLEVEAEGTYTSIPANGSLSWSTQWRVAKIPSSVTVAAGSATLLSFAQQQAAM
ncbi:MAG TPA: hypothetical protein VK841_04285 [Polyangiaceae bacterium]|jgi:hypothetical protein|nr:hypothetical protein [Polyangiaceae bacterium]